MRIIARCHDRVLLRIETNRLAEVTLRAGVAEDVDGVLEGQVGRSPTRKVKANLDTLEVSRCDGCSNYGPRDVPRSDQGVFQQFALKPGAYPWRGNRKGYYCMGCSMPPR